MQTINKFCLAVIIFLISLSLAHSLRSLRLHMQDKKTQFLEEFRENANRKFRIGEKPAGGLFLGFINFKKEVIELNPIKALFQKSLSSLPESMTLGISNEAVRQAELNRETNDGRVEVNKVARVLYDVGCYFLDNFFDKRPIARFWFLETVARVPYFSYVSM